MYTLGLDEVSHLARNTAARWLAPVPDMVWTDAICEQEVVRKGIKTVNMVVLSSSSSSHIQIPRRTTYSTGSQSLTCISEHDSCGALQELWVPSSWFILVPNHQIQSQILASKVNSEQYTYIMSWVLFEQNSLGLICEASSGSNRLILSKMTNYLMNSIYLMIVSLLVSINANPQINLSWRFVVVCLLFQVKHWVYRTWQDVFEHAHDVSSERMEELKKCQICEFEIYVIRVHVGKKERSSRCPRCSFGVSRARAPSPSLIIRNPLSPHSPGLSAKDNSP